MRYRLRVLVLALILVGLSQAQSSAATVKLRYAWMLPKTVIDTTIVYTFQDCKNGAKISITPTLVSRTLPDLRVGQKSIEPETLEAFSKDKGISLQTFGSSGILNSIGSQPTSETSQIVGNILGGVAKLVGVFAPFALTAEAPPAPKCATGEESGAGIAEQIAGLKGKIKNYEKELSDGVDEAAQKRYAAAIQAAQSLITTLQSQLTISIKTTIDPGVSPVVVDTENDTSSYQIHGNGDVDNSTLIAMICPSKKQLEKAKWFSNLEELFGNGRTACQAVPSLMINVYLDFPNGHSTMYEPDHTGPYKQTESPDGDHYRDVGYIPVLVWRGEKKSGDPSKDADGTITGPVQLAPPLTMPFGQFGVSQKLPLEVRNFRSINWAVTFLESGERTNATFTSKAWGLNATNLFGSAASTANSIVTQERSIASPSTRATTLQGQADLIYQTERLHLCEQNPAKCPSK